MAALEFKILQKTNKKAKRELQRRKVSKLELNNSAKKPACSKSGKFLSVTVGATVTLFFDLNYLT